MIRTHTLKLLYHYKMKQLAFICLLLISSSIVAQKPITFEYRDTTFEVGAIKSFRTIVYQDARFSNEPQTKPSLDSIADFMLQNKQLTIEIGVHTSYRGSSKYNLHLTDMRANAIRNYVIDKGVEESRVLAKGYGESKLIYSEELIDKMLTSKEKEAAHALNRRTVLTILSIK